MIGGRGTSVSGVRRNPVGGAGRSSASRTHGDAALRRCRTPVLALALGLAACTTGTRAPEPRAGFARDTAAGTATATATADSAAAPATNAATAAVPVGRAAVEALEFEPLRFEPPRPERFELSNGVSVFFLPDASLPVVDLMADFRGGYPDFARDDYAAAVGIGSLLLNGGTESLPPDSVDKLVEYYALSPSFGTAGALSFSSIGTLRRNLDVALPLWADMLRRPRFDPGRVEVWRLRELESVRRLRDLPNTVAIREFNHLMYGDHPSGWQLEERDLTPEHLAERRLLRVHREIFCRDNLILGVTGDVTREELVRRLEAAFGDWPPCPRKLEKPVPPAVRREGGVLIVQKEIEQSTVVMGQAGGVSKSDGDAFYASQIANWILGGGGFSSRLLSRLRTEDGLAYQAWSVWVTGNTTERVFGAFTQTRAETTVTAAARMRETIAAMRDAEPAQDEVRLAVDNIANGFVFAFESPAQVVSRQMGYRIGGLPEDWLERYLKGVQAVTPTAVRDVAQRNIRPGSLTVVIVGDTTRFDASPDSLGPRIRR